MTPRSQRLLAAAALGLALAACHGNRSSGAPPNAAPTLVGAACVSNTGTPGPGDQLILTFSEPIALAAGAVLDDADVTLGAGDSLGTVAAAPTLVGANALFVLLGPGAQITPGTSTITMRNPANGTGNDAVLDATSQFALAGDAVTIGLSDGAPPTVTDVTIAAIQPALNGRGTAGGTLQTPSGGFTIVVTHQDNVGVDATKTRLTVSRSVAVPGGSVAAGADLAPFLTRQTATATETRFLVPAGVRFVDGATTIEAIAIDGSGLGSTPGAFPLTVRAFNDARQPFETRVNAEQTWFLDFRRDIESFTALAAGGAADVQVQPGPNGRSDFEDILLVLGLLAPTPLPNVVGVQDSNQIVVQRFQQELLTRLAAFYDGAKVAFTTTVPTTPFGGAASIDYNSFGHSRMAIAGSADAAGVLGRAIFDPNNATQNDDSRADFFGTRLGVFLHTIVDFGLGQSPLSSFRQTYDAFTPVFGGTPIGGTAADAGRLAGTTTDARRTAIDVAIRDFARFCATVVAHECGHSMGLVQDGAMPLGLYGGDDVNFPGSSTGHIRNTALFPAGSTNVMSPSLSYDTAISSNTAFNRLNLAYLREQVTYGN